MERQVIERYAGRSVVVYLKPDYEKIQGVLELGDGVFEVMSTNGEIQ